MTGEGRAERGTGSWSDTRRSFPRKVAKAIIKRDVVCQLQWAGCTGAAEEADHIVNDATARRLGWDQDTIDDPGNGQGVCRSCHKQKTKGEQQAGQQRRRASGLRPKAPHPGLIR